MENTDATAPARDSAPLKVPAPRPGRGWDRLSLVSSVGAGVFGVGTILNNIRDRFYRAFVLGYNESVTPFTPIVEKYTGRGGPHSGNEGAFSKNSRKKLEAERQFEAKEISAEEYKTACTHYRNEAKRITKEFRTEVEEKLLHDFNIPTKGIEGWTVGSWKRWQELGITARKDAAISFATVAAIGLGTLTLLRHNKYTLDRVEDKLDDSRDQLGHGR